MFVCTHNIFMRFPFFRKSLQWQGYDLKKAGAIYKQAASWNEEERLAQRDRILKHHVSTNRFYSQITTSTTVSWDKIPVLTKTDLQRPLIDRLSDGYKRKAIFKGSTSGSSGHPFTFAKDKLCHAITWAAFDAAYKMHNIDLDHSIEARFYGIPASGLPRLKERLKDTVGNRVRFPIFNMNGQVLDNYIKKFQRVKFNYINGYTSSIVLFAKHCELRNLKLIDVCPSLQACIVTSEMLFPDDRILLERVLGVPVINEYGSSENGLIALQNPEGDLILNSTTMFVEVLDDYNNPVPDGDIGHITITDLFNKAHPFIRYKIGDLGSVVTLDNKRILKHLQGRTSDIARLPNGKIIPGLTFYYVTKTIINETNKVREFVIIQKKPLLFQILYVADSILTTKEQNGITRSMATYADASIQVQFERSDSLDRSSRGKLKQFISELS